MDHLAAPLPALMVRASRVCSFFMTSPVRVSALLTTTALVTTSTAAFATPMEMTHQPSAAAAHHISATHKGSGHTPPYAWCHIRQYGRHAS